LIIREMETFVEMKVRESVESSNAGLS